MRGKKSGQHRSLYNSKVAFDLLINNYRRLCMKVENKRGTAENTEEGFAEGRDIGYRDADEKILSKRMNEDEVMECQSECRQNKKKTGKSGLLQIRDPWSVNDPIRS